jgi:hypothetical protein
VIRTLGTVDEAIWRGMSRRFTVSLHSPQESSPPVGGRLPRWRLAHVVRDQTKVAYCRGDALEKRRWLKTAWARYCAEKAVDGKVLSMQREGEPVAVRKIIRGTGITMRQVNNFGGTPEEVAATLEAAAERRGFEGKIVEIERMAVGILIEAGCDPERVRLVVYEDDTAPEYAHEVRNRIRQIRADIASGCADGAARWSFELGYLCCEFAMKLDVERPALYGQASLARLARARDTANGSPIERRDRWHRQCAAFDAARETGLKKMAAYEAAAGHCGVSSKAVQRSVQRRDKNL